MTRFALIAVLVPAVVLAQTTQMQEGAEVPDEEWASPPPESMPVRPVEPARPPPAPPVPGDAPTVTVPTPSSKLPPNTVGMFGARTLGHLVRGEMLFVGFPKLGVRFAMGFGDRFDVGVGYEGFYFMMNEVVLGARVTAARGKNWSLAAVVDGSVAFFTQKPVANSHGPRWYTGRRDFNVNPGLVLAWQGDHPRAARLFFDLRYLLTFDTQPYQRQPLGGVPASVQLGHNATFRAGTEMPLSEKTSFVFLLGLDIHGRSDDSVVMPTCSVGLVTSI